LTDDPTLARPLPYELRVGVTGHRNLTDSAAVSEAVDGLLSQIEKTLASASANPHGPAGPRRGSTERLGGFLAPLVKLFWWSIPLSPKQTRPDRRTPIRWIAISALAKGADRIVAKQVLTRPDSQLRAVLPLPGPDYEADFTDPEDLEEFRRLVAKDPEPIVVGKAENGLEPLARNEAYFKGGTHVVDQAEVLIAVWDGKEAAGHGGTAEIVGAALSRGLPVFWIDSGRPDRPARLIDPTMARQDPETAEPGRILGWVTTEIPNGADQISPSFVQLDAYNRDQGCANAMQQTNQSECAESLERAARSHGLSVAALKAAIGPILPHYARADCLAVLYQGLYRRAGVILYVLATLAVATAVAQTLFWPARLWVIWVEVVALVAIVVLHVVNRAGGWHQRWLVYRQLAEQLRSGMSLALLGESPVLSRSRFEEILPAYHGPEAWILDASRSLLHPAHAKPGSPDNIAPLRDFLVETWIEDQAKWHRTNAEKKQKSVRSAHRWGYISFVITLLLGGLHASGSLHHEETVGAIGGDANLFADLAPRLLTFLSIVLPVVGASIHAVASLLEHERIAARSARMENVLGTIAQETREATSIDELRAACARAHHVMSIENHEWLVSLSFRILQPPT